MSLRRKMGLQIAAIVVGMLVIAAASLWGFNGLRADYTLALHGLIQLRSSYDIGTQQHGGTIKVASEVGAFTEFTVRLPRRFATGASVDSAGASERS